jgi:hypothetical protein
MNSATSDLEDDRGAALIEAREAKGCGKVGDLITSRSAIRPQSNNRDKSGQARSGTSWLARQSCSPFVQYCTSESGTETLVHAERGWRAMRPVQCPGTIGIECWPARGNALEVKHP